MTYEEQLAEFNELESKYKGKRGRKPKRYYQLKNNLEILDAKKELDEGRGHEVSFEDLDEIINSDDLPPVNIPEEAKPKKIVTDTEAEMASMGVPTDALIETVEGGSELKKEILDDQNALDFINQQIEQLEEREEFLKEQEQIERKASGKRGRAKMSEERKDLRRKKKEAEKNKEEYKSRLAKNKPHLDGILMSEMAAGTYHSVVLLYGKMLQNLPQKNKFFGKIAFGAKKVNWEITETEQNQIAMALRAYFAEQDFELTPTQQLTIALAKPILFKTLETFMASAQNEG